MEMIVFHNDKNHQFFFNLYEHKQGSQLCKLTQIIASIKSFYILYIYIYACLQFEHEHALCFLFLQHLTNI